MNKSQNVASSGEQEVNEKGSRCQWDEKGIK